MKFRWSLVAILMLATSTYYAQETNAPKFGKGLFNLVGKDSSFTMKVGFRMQLLGTSTWQDGESLETSMLIRRSRLKFDGFAFSPKLQYKVELGLANRDMSGASQYTSNSPRYVMDAVLKWNFAGNFVLWAGQTKLPGNRERVISSADLQLVDRSLVNSRFNIDRDMGLQLRHHFNLTNKFIVKEIASISQGEGRNVTTGNEGGHQYTGRVELYPFGDFQSKGDYKGSDLNREQTPKLAVGATYNFNNNAVRDRGNLGSYMETNEGLYETNISTIFIDAMFKYKGFSFMGEYADRTADDPIAKNADGSLTGAEVQVGKGLNLQSGYLFKNNWEVTGRYTNVELDKNITGKNPETQYTLGLSKFIVGHKLKVQTDISYLDVPTNNGQVMYRLQCDIHF
ncbi:OprO/OprP family phosphate-selective porin [Aestuariibaculum sp. M13]|uniref:OprO/OprP family phosphate-selective porin n=1 Tax=Aestuariibaculum sp. M13 TaxID=2967132 RepID=UPI002159CFF6|nr:OprO/OprP family phosphate-selective porin [Aestuariibaculum sp. M13]MCR8669432.1 OprO/OprP family phosphate-selective porin [Aestuariibaculum sp. M13]